MVGFAKTGEEPELFLEPAANKKVAAFARGARFREHGAKRRAGNLRTLCETVQRRLIGGTERSLSGEKRGERIPRPAPHVLMGTPTSPCSGNGRFAGSRQA